MIIIGKGFKLQNSCHVFLLIIKTVWSPRTKTMDAASLKSVLVMDNTGKTNEIGLRE